MSEPITNEKVKVKRCKKNKVELVIEEVKENIEGGVIGGPWSPT